MATDGDLQDSDAKAGGGPGAQKNPGSSRESAAGKSAQANADRDADAALLALARSGDREAWARLCHKHAPRLAAYLGARLRRPAVVE
ncbi:MAG: hypothetical protein H0W83_08065, partial [Planctomycetes bacterium]|nr:hypothetical protein [Planctomycetota bacterium]